MEVSTEVLRWIGLLMLAVLTGCSTAPEPEFDLLVAGGAVLTLDGSDAVHDPGYVGIRGDSIVAVGRLEASRGRRARRVIDASNRIIIPGLINGHQHAPMSLMRGLADDLLLMDWLENYIFPAESRVVDPGYVYWGTLAAVVEMVASGTTTYADMYYFEDEVARATADAGMRGVLGQTIIDFPAPDHASPTRALEYTARFIDRWKGHPLIVPAVAPHAPYTCSAETLRAALQLAEDRDVPLLIHLAESRAEVVQVRDRSGLTPIRYLENLGVLADRMVAAHVIWADSEEISLLAGRGVGVIHNPQSNMKLGEGVAPVPEMLAAGVDVGVGTDGPASNNNFDLLEEMDSMARLHKLDSQDPTVAPAGTVLRAATVGGARALGREDLGSLETGKKADLVILRSSAAAPLPVYDYTSTVVYSLTGGSVETVVINGRVVMEKRRFPHLNMEEIARHVGEYEKRVRQAVAR